MTLDFIKDDPVGQGFDAQFARDERVRQAREAVGVDAAIRGGLGDVIAGQQQQQAPQPQYASLPSSAPPSTATDAGPASGGGGLTGTMHSFEGTGLNPSPGVEGAGAGGFGQVIPTTYADWKSKYGAANPWMPATHADYVAATSGNTPEGRALGERLYNDVVIPNEYTPALRNAGLEVSPANIAIINFLGPAGGPKFLQALQSNPQAIAADIVGQAAAQNGSNLKVFYDGARPRTVAEVMQIVTKGGGGSAPSGGQPNVMLADATASGVALGGSNGLPGMTGPNYNPILARLQDQPGGGKVALDILGRQTRTDMGQARRLDQYQKLAMIAMGKGDVTTARYYAQLGGLQLPDAVFQDAGLMKRTAMGSLMAQRIYRTDAQAGQVFLQTYLRTGNADAAFAAAGAPRDNPSFSPVWVKGIENDLLYSFNRRDGTMTPTVNPGAPAAPATPAPAAPVAAVPAPPPPPAAPVDLGGPTGAGPLSLGPPPVLPPAVSPAPTDQAPAPAMPPPAAAPGAPGQISRPALTSQGKIPNALVRQKMLIDAGMPPAQAAAIAAGAAPTANGIITAMGSAARIVDPMGIMEPNERQTAIAKWMDDAFGPAWRDRLRGPSGAPAASSGAPPPQYQPLTLAPARGPTPPAAARDLGSPAQPVPPPEQRQRGATYQTPRGPMVWTGTGWVAPAQ